MMSRTIEFYNITRFLTTHTMLPHGLEPWTSRLLAERSNQLSYESKCDRLGPSRVHAKDANNSDLCYRPLAPLA